jgi:hypothetical protein
MLYIVNINLLKDVMIILVCYLLLEKNYLFLPWKDNIRFYNIFLFIGKNCYWLLGCFLASSCFGMSFSHSGPAIISLLFHRISHMETWPEMINDVAASPVVSFLA